MVTWKSRSIIESHLCSSAFFKFWFGGVIPWLKPLGLTPGSVLGNHPVERWDKSRSVMCKEALQPHLSPFSFWSHAQLCPEAVSGAPNSAWGISADASQAFAREAPGGPSTACVSHCLESCPKASYIPITEQSSPELFQPQSWDQAD